MQSACPKPKMCSNCGRKGHKKMECPQGDGKGMVCNNCGACAPPPLDPPLPKQGDHSG